MSVTSTAFEIDPPEVEEEERLYVMEELEQVLPMRRGISKLYYGKSKSFTSLADASASSSIQEIVKPENMYARRRRNLLSFNRIWDNVRSSSPCKGNATGGISKRPLGSSKSTLALAVAMTHSESFSYASNDFSSSNFSHSPPPATSPTKPRIPGPSQFPSAEELSLLDVDHHVSTSRPTCVDRPLPSIALKTGLEEQT